MTHYVSTLDERVFRAANNDDAAELARLREQGVSFEGENEAGRCALGFCVIRSRTQAAPAVLAAGLDPNRKDSHGETPFGMSITSRNAAFFDLFLPVADLSQKDRLGLDALELACKAHWERGVSALLALGSDALSGRGGTGALGVALMAGASECADALAAWAVGQPPRVASAKKQKALWVEVAQAAAEERPERFPRFLAAQEAAILREEVALAAKKAPKKKKSAEAGGSAASPKAKRRL